MTASFSLPIAPSDARWLAHRYDPEHDAVHLIDVPRDVRRAAPFLTDADLPPSPATQIVARAGLSQAITAAPLHFVFHSAYCCSTLVANAFDRPGIATTLKEPVMLNDMVGWRHRGGDPRRIQSVLDDALTLLARPFEAGEAVIVKPSNVINALIPAILTLRPDARCVLLHAPLPVYLASIARKGMWGRLWVRDLLAKQLRDGANGLGFTPDDYFRQTDLQIAAVGWLAQQRAFGEIARRWPGRVRTLDSEVLMAQPDRSIAAMATLFNLSLDTNQIDAIVQGDAFTRNSKDGRQYDAGDRLAEQRQARDIYGDELEKVGLWAEAVASGAGFSLDLPAALLA